MPPTTPHRERQTSASPAANVSTEKPKVFVPIFKSAPPFQVTYLPNGWGVAIIRIDAELAREMLSRNVKNQRDSKPRSIAKFSEDMSAGSWRLTHQGIAFNDAGHLYDGQNRLTAISASDVAVDMLVFFTTGAIADMKVVDTGNPRTFEDSSKISGEEIKRRSMSAYNAMIRYGLINGVSFASLQTHTSKAIFVSRCRSEIDKVAAWIGCNKLATKICQAPVRGAILCATFYVDHDVLARFCRVLTEQSDAEPGDDGAKILRQFITSHERINESESFLKTCRAIQCFVGREEVKRNLYACPENPYPVPKRLYILDHQE